MKILWGEISPNMGQRMMELLADDLQACKAGKLNDMPIKRLAQLGTRGKYPGNVWRDMKKFYQNRNYLNSIIFGCTYAFPIYESYCILPESLSMFLYII